MNGIIFKQTNVLVQEANEGGSHDVPVFAAELHRRLYPIIHHQSKVLVNWIRAVIGKLKRGQKKTWSLSNQMKEAGSQGFLGFFFRSVLLTFVPGHTRKVKRRHGIIFR